MGDVIDLSERKGLKLAEEISHILDGIDVPSCMEAISIVFAGLCGTIKDLGGEEAAREFKSDLLKMMVEYSDKSV